MQVETKMWGYLQPTKPGLIPDGVACSIQIVVPNSLLDNVLKALKLKDGPLPAPAVHSTQDFSETTRRTLRLTVPWPVPLWVETLPETVAVSRIDKGASTDP